MFAWLWRLISGTSETTAQPKGLGGTEMDHQVREEVVRNRRKVSPKKGDSSPKPTRVRSNNTGKAGGKSKRPAVRTPATKSKAKSKTV
jgi:hypothetical protein